MKKSKLIKKQEKEIESLLDLIQQKNIKIKNMIELKDKTIKNLLEVIESYDRGENK